MDATFEEDSRDHGIRPHVSELRRGEARDDAGQRLSAFFANAQAVERCFALRPVIAVFSAPSGLFPARQFSWPAHARPPRANEPGCLDFGGSSTSPRDRLHQFSIEL
jgi:hypothetical protein